MDDEVATSASRNNITEVLMLTLRLSLNAFWSIFSVFSDLALVLLVFVTVILGALTQVASVGLWGSYLPPPILRHEIVFPNADVLAFRENADLNLTEFRLLVDVGTVEKAVKYATVNSNVMGLGVRKDRYSSTEVVQMPSLPKGDYCSVSIGLAQNGKQTALTTTSCQRLPGVNGAWHEESFDFFDLKILPWLNSTDRVQLVQHPALSHAVMKYAPFAHTIESISKEIQMYQLLQGSYIAPKFLGQVVEHGRVIGFLMEYIEDARLVSLSGRFSDLAIDKCKQSLERLHSIGIIHNDAHPNNCLLRTDGTAVLIDFEHATLASTVPALPNPQDFERDFRLLSQ
ncbi:hypothetical protein F4782DRAFT_525418 [Xylaria castorea]|nr:hypothetical protein F4782DRAFT_525418 [Xylaria castorea]